MGSFCNYFIIELEINCFTVVVHKLQPRVNWTIDINIAIVLLLYSTREKMTRLLLIVTFLFVTYQGNVDSLCAVEHPQTAFCKAGFGK